MDRKHLVRVLSVMSRHFSQIDFHTNGILLPKLGPDYLRELYGAGLTNLTISVAHYDEKRNGELMGVRRPYLKRLFDWLHTYGDGIHVRLSCLLAKGYIDTAKEMKRYCDFAVRNGASSVVFRGLWVTNDGRTKEDRWSRGHRVDMGTLFRKFWDGSKPLFSLPWGDVYDYKGIAVSATECDFRQVDFVKSLNLLPDNHLYYAWGTPASRLW
jgi:uncharacterized Fe-S cluster-containing radical SAM superfamily enzyme